MISLSVIPACILKISISFSKNSDNFLISEVFPHPVSPIIITGTFALIRNIINIIFEKLSAVNA